MEMTGPAVPEHGLQAFGDWVLAALGQHADGAGLLVMHRSSVRFFETAPSRRCPKAGRPFRSPSTWQGGRRQVRIPY